MSEAETNNVLTLESTQQQEALQSASAGARLAAYRQERGLTIEQVSSQLNLASRQIVALENDDYSALPGTPIVRGFIRSYAKLLKIDPTPLLASIGGEIAMAHESLEPRKSLSTPFSEASTLSMADRPGLSSKWVVGGLLAVLLGVAIWAAQQSPEVRVSTLQKTASSQVKDSLVNLSASEAMKSADEKRPEASAPVAIQSGPQTINPSVAANAGQPEEVKTEVAKSAGNTSTTETAKQAADAGTAGAMLTQAGLKPATAIGINETASGKDALVFTIHEDSWIEVRRSKDKKVLLSGLMKAGTTESVEVTEPVSVVVGNTTGVSANLRGESVELKSDGNVARLVLK